MRELRCNSRNIAWLSQSANPADSTNVPMLNTICSGLGGVLACHRVCTNATVQPSRSVSPKPKSAIPTRMNGKLSDRSEEHTSELQSRQYLVCRLLLEKKKKKRVRHNNISKQ